MPRFRKHRSSCAQLAGSLAILAGLLMLAQAVRAEDAPAPENTQLPEVKVEGKKNPFEESDRRLRELLQKSTPCIGCDAKKPLVPPSLVGKILDTAAGLVTPQSSKPKDHDSDQQEEVDRANYERRHPSNSTP